MRIGIIQTTSTNDKTANLQRANDLMLKAVADGAELLVLPENFSFMADDEDKLSVGETMENGESVKFLQHFAATHKVVVVGGTLPLIAPNNKVSNTCLIYNEKGELVARYDKMHLFDIYLNDKATFVESAVIQGGNEVVTAELLGQMMGVAICYDLRFPELFRRLVDQGAKVLFLPAAFTIPTGSDHWEVLLRARAIENQCYVVAAGQYGRHNKNRASYGRSMVIDPWGQVLVKAQDKETYITCDLDFEHQASIRQKLPCLTHRKL